MCWQYPGLFSKWLDCSSSFCGHHCRMCLCVVLFMLCASTHPPKYPRSPSDGPRDRRDFRTRCPDDVRTMTGVQHEDARFSFGESSHHPGCNERICTYTKHIWPSSWYHQDIFPSRMEGNASSFQIVSKRIVCDYVRMLGRFARDTLASTCYTPVIVRS